MTSITGTINALGGIARVATLRQHGISVGVLRAAVAAGLVLTPRRGWVATTAAHPDVLAAVSMGGRLGCVSAASYLDLWTFADSTPLHVALPTHSGHASAHLETGALAHWQSARWTDRGSAIESIESVCIELLRCQPREFAIATIDSALNHKLISLPTLHTVLSELPRDTASAIDEVDANSQAGTESLCRQRIRRMRLPVRTQVFVDGVGRLDLLIGHRLVVEADSRQWHDNPNQYAEDRRRDLALNLLGYRSIRLTWEQVMFEWPLVELSIRAAVSRREHLWPAGRNS